MKNLLFTFFILVAIAILVVNPLTSLAQAQGQTAQVSDDPLLQPFPKIGLAIVGVVAVVFVLIIVALMIS
jgi:hypothetical protein